VYRFISNDNDYKNKLKKIKALLASDKAFLDHVAEIYEDYVGEDFALEEERPYG